MSLRRSASSEQVRASLDPKTINLETREFEVVVSTGARAPMYGRLDNGTWGEFNEELEISTRACDLSRIEAGACPLIDSHNVWGGLANQIGTVLRAWVSGSQLRALVRFSRDPAHEGMWQNVVAGVIRSCSPRYTVAKYKKTDAGGDGKPPVFLATRWQIRELSLVPIPADMDARIRANAPSEETAELENDSLGGNMDPEELKKLEQARSQQPATPNTPPAAPPVAPAPAPAPAPERQRSDAAAVEEERRLDAARREERERIDQIRSSCRQLGVDEGTEGQAFVENLIKQGTSIENARQAITFERVRRDRGVTASPAVSVGEEERTKFRAAMGAALNVRANVREAKVQPGAEHFAGMSLLRMVEECNVRQFGSSARTWDRDTTLSRGLHTTSDFPLLLADTFNKRLREGYGYAPFTWRTLGRRSDLNDFKTRYVLNFGEAPQLEEVVESGQIKRGTMAEARESYRLKTYAKIIGLSRQAFINDDLSAFDSLAAKFGRQAAELESSIVWALITGNVTMGDSIALFHASHGNLGAGVIALGTTSTGLTQALMKMRLQKGMDGVTPLNLTPRALVVPAALEVVARQYVAQITAATAGTVNPFAGAFPGGVIVEPRLDAVDAAAWYVVGDPMLCDIVEYAYLRGQDGVYTESRAGFEVDGVEFKARHDFGAGVVDYRNIYKSTGS